MDSRGGPGAEAANDDFPKQAFGAGQAYSAAVRMKKVNIS